MKRAKKGLAAILSTCMLLSLLPAAAFAEGAPAADTLEEAAQPTTVEKTLAEMFADAQDGETLRLEQDVTVTGQEDADYKNSGTVTLDLNGHTITGDNKNIALRAIGTEAGKGTLKITNGTIKTNSGTYCTVGAKDAALELSDMRLENSTAYGCSVKAFAGGTIDLKKVCSTSQTGGGVEAAGGTVNIYDSTFTQTGYYDHNSVNLAASGGTGTVNVYGGSFTSENYGLYIFSSGGTINVYDGTFKAGEEKAVVKADLDLNSYPAATANINIYGGDFTGKIDIADKEEVHVEITGGTFADTGLTKEAFSAYTAEGTVVTEGPDGTFTVKELDETNGVAEVGGRYYASLQKAVDNAGKGETVTLLQNTAEDIVIPERAELTLNLNGKTLTNHEDHTITNKGTLTITGGGTVDNVTHARAAIQNEPGGNVVLNGGAYTRSKENGQNAEASGGNSYYNIVNHGTMEINSGVSVMQNGQFSSMIENGWYNGSQNTGKENSVLTINGGTFSGGLNTIKNDDYGELVINDGTFTSMSQAAFLNWNVATVNGGTFDAAGASNGVILNGYIDGTMDQGKLTINGGTFNAGEKTVITTMGGGTHSGDIEITGGTLNGSIVLTDSSEGARLTITQKAKVTGNVTNSGKADVAITDGATVDGQVSNSAGGTMSVVNSTIGSVPEGTTAETIVIVNSTVDGTLTTNTAENAAVMVGGKTYETLGAAITAAKAGDTIYVLKDIPEAAGIAVPSGKNFTIDFGGHTYTLKDPGAGSAGTESNGFQFLMNSTITLKNGTVRIAEGTTSIKRIIQNYANLTLEDMHFFAEHQADGEDYALRFNNGSIIFKGDTDIVTTSDEAIAFDVCKYSSYPSTNVAFDESYTGTINGKIVYDSTDADTHKLTIQGNGTFGAIEAASGAAEAAKSGIEVTSGHFAKPVNEDYLADSVKAQLESASNPEAPYSYYPSLEAAQAAAQPGDTITEVNATSGEKKYNVTLDYADGDTKDSVYTVTEGTELTLPTPSRSGYTFEGWYDGSSRVSSPYKVTKDVILTAEWDYNGSSSSSGSTRYTVSVEDTDNGSVKVSPTRASKGSTVTVTVKPDEGYELDKLTVTDKNGDSVKLTDKGDGKYTFKMPASKVTVEAVFTAVEPEPEGLPFTDVTSGDWFYDAVAYVYDKGMMEGTTDTTFAPTMNLTRSMIAQVLYNLEERPEAPGAAGFPDVAAGAWYADAVNWAAARGIVKGYDTGAFGPEDSVTREQLAAILYRYAQAKGYDTTQGGMAVREFSDSASISDWAQTAMSWAVNAQVLSGKGNGVLDPQGTATRAEVAQMLMNFGEHVG
ncbi:S-layer homology domain-containing protein [Flavonifractor plautii]|uniref:S-layer homology domain-containing protein n=1 Tax=Flavonifractor plautii TaxID=292800 RepID=UPI002108715C|nr:S-layer homology domain-containing protein [Flavonifractor plautii]MCQ4658180.1 S-layer homology domain-containing protein [Flavonifractor plautii]MCQ4684958.1 S-layer homology domain-containing protein [Flavonifractor plautii]MCQ4717014.1 S-layer homology domain-containing protein [Flavonifractor plautii]